MSESQDLTFLFDVDNTLLDNDESNCNSHSVSRVQRRVRSPRCSRSREYQHGPLAGARLVPKSSWPGAQSLRAFCRRSGLSECGRRPGPRRQVRIRSLVCRIVKVFFSSCASSYAAASPCRTPVEPAAVAPSEFHDAHADPTLQWRPIPYTSPQRRSS
jgi:hypothetical protein